MQGMMGVEPKASGCAIVSNSEAGASALVRTCGMPAAA